MSAKRSERNAHRRNQALGKTSNQYYPFHTGPLTSISYSLSNNMFFSLKSIGTLLSNQNEPYARGESTTKDFRANHTREDLEVESSIILKRYGKILKIFLRDSNKICLLCELKREQSAVDPKYLISQTNLLRKYYPASIKGFTSKIQKMCKVMFYDLNKIIFKARRHNSQQMDSSQTDYTADNQIFEREVELCTKTEIREFRKFLIDHEEIKANEDKEFLFVYHTKRDYNDLFERYYRINQFNLIRPKLHVDEVTKLQKSNYDKMWKLRQKILRHLVAEKSESFVLKINVSQLNNFKPEKSEIIERLGKQKKSRSIFDSRNYCFIYI